MTPDETRPIDKLLLPFGKEVAIEEIVFDAEVRLLRLRIRERSRFTIVDLDPDSAEAWGARLLEWAAGERAAGSTGDDRAPEPEPEPEAP